MRTRRASYPSPSDGITFIIRPKVPPPQKRRKLAVASDEPVCRTTSSSYSSSASSSSSTSSVDSLHDELVISIMVALSSTSTSPADLINAMLTCKRFCAAGASALVLCRASMAALAVKAAKWSEGAERFLTKCAAAGNVEAAYTLGMIRFYCYSEREEGASLMAQAALASHASALHSLAIIQFNGSGGSRKDKNLKNGASLCAKAAAQGHVDAMRELGHCLQDGYGVPKNIPEGRRLLLEANAREAAAAIAASPSAFVETALQLAYQMRCRCLYHHLQQNRTKPAPTAGPDPASAAAPVAPVAPHPLYRFLQGGGCSLLSDFGCNVPPAKGHIANQFLVEWYCLRPPPVGLRLCSHAYCGRPETRRHEFRRCSACGSVNYCSRACQALDWKLRHKFECSPVADWDDHDDVAAANVAPGAGHANNNADVDANQQQHQHQHQEQLT